MMSEYELYIKYYRLLRNYESDTSHWRWDYLQGVEDAVRIVGHEVPYRKAMQSRMAVIKGDPLLVPLKERLRRCRNRQLAYAA